MKEYGVIEYRECVGDDMKTTMGLPFPKLVKPKPNEVIVFSWISFKSKANRNSINKKIMKENTNGKLSNFLGFTTLILMTVAAATLIYFQFSKG